MGYYIQVPNHHNKAEQIVRLHGGRIVSEEEAEDSLIAGEGVVVVVDNGPFEAAAFAFSHKEFSVFVDPRDPRPKKFVVMEREKAELLSGYRR